MFHMWPCEGGRLELPVRRKDPFPNPKRAISQNAPSKVPLSVGSSHSFCSINGEQVMVCPFGCQILKLGIALK